jgi:hypothetical protein
MSEELAHVTWRETAKYPRAFWVLDARLAWPWLAWIVHISWWTFGFAVVASLLNALLARLAMPPAMAWRRLKSALRGGACPARRPRRLFVR